MDGTSKIILWLVSGFMTLDWYTLSFVLKLHHHIAHEEVSAGSTNLFKSPACCCITTYLFVVKRKQTKLIILWAVFLYNEHRRENGVVLFLLVYF